ncbi:hypothetical protein Tco_0612796 [Tanacetum coccineum]
MLKRAGRPNLSLNWEQRPFILVIKDVVLSGQEALDILKACHSGLLGGPLMVPIITQQGKMSAIQDSFGPPSTKDAHGLVTVVTVVNSSRKITLT